MKKILIAVGLALGLVTFGWSQDSSQWNSAAFRNALSAMVSTTTSVFRLPSYTVTTFPTAATRGRPAYASNSSRGVWVDSGTQWFSLNSRTYNLTEQGIVGDGVTDDGPALQATIDGAPDFSTFTCTRGMRIKLGATINVHNRKGLRFIGLGGRLGQSVDQNLNTGGPCHFIWGGSALGTMWSINRSRELSFESLAWVAGTASKPINIDQTITPATQITTNIVFNNVFIIQGELVGASFVGIDVGEATSQNQENIRIYDSDIVCNAQLGSGVRFDGANTKGIKIIHSSFSNCDRGINFQNGSGTIRGNFFADNNIDIEASNGTDPYIIEFNLTENFRQYFVYGKRSCCAYTVAHIMGNSIAGTYPGKATYPSILTGAQTILVGNEWDVDNTLVPIAPGSAENDGLLSMGNTYPNDNNSLDAFGTGTGGNTNGYISLMDRLVTDAGGRQFDTRIDKSRITRFALQNAIGLSAYEAAGVTRRTLMVMNSSDQMVLGSTTNALLVNQLKTTGAAAGKKVVCVDTTTGQLYASSSDVSCAN